MEVGRSLDKVGRQQVDKVAHKMATKIWKKMQRQTETQVERRQTSYADNTWTRLAKDRRWWQNHEESYIQQWIDTAW